MNDFLNPNNESMNQEDEREEVLSPEVGENTENDIPQENAQSLPHEEEQTTFEEQTADEPEYRELQNSFNPVNYTEVKPINDYKPMNKGLKVFALIIVVIIAMSSCCVAGYFLGKSGSAINTGASVPKMDLAARPKDTDEMTAAQVYETVNKTVVGILVYNDGKEAGQASGIIYSKDGYIVTNDHIYSEIPSARFKVYTHDGKEYDAKYVAGDKISDLAVLKIDGEVFEPASFGDSDQLFSGQNVVAIGRPDGAESPSSITSGIVSAVNRRVRNSTNYSARLIQIDCAINPGNSGGALSDMYGHIVGITCSKLAGSVYDNVGYAIPTTVMQRIVKELIEEGKVVSRAKLGITYTAVNSVMADLNGYKTTGLLIASVSEDSGLYGQAEEGDFITRINGEKVTSDDVVLDILENQKAGNTVDITVVTSSGKSKTVKVKLQANIGESSYTTEAALPEKSENGGTFDFPLD